MNIAELRNYLLKLYFKEKDAHTRELIDDIWHKLPESPQVKEIPCCVGKKHGYKWRCWIMDDIIPKGMYPWDYDGHVARRTYALVEDPNGRLIKVIPEKIRFDTREAERWEDLHG